MLDSIFNPDCHDPASYVGDRASPEVKAKARSLAARAHFDKLMLVERSPDGWSRVQAEERRFEGRLSPHVFMLGAQELRPPLSYLAVATHHADQAATLGLVAPVVLQVGFYLRDVGDVVGIDVAKMDGAKQYKVRWRVVVRRARGAE